MSFLPTASHAASAFGMSFVPISSMQHVCGGVQTRCRQRSRHSSRSARPPPGRRSTPLWAVAALTVVGSFGAAAACSTWWLARELNALRARGKLADEDAGRPQIALTR